VSDSFFAFGERVVPGVDLSVLEGRSYGIQSLRNSLIVIKMQLVTLVLNVNGTGFVDIEVLRTVEATPDASGGCLEG
jgi:hypothetical protein